MLHICRAILHPAIRQHTTWKALFETFILQGREKEGGRKRGHQEANPRNMLAFSQSLVQLAEFTSFCFTEIKCIADGAKRQCFSCLLLVT